VFAAHVLQQLFDGDAEREFIDAGFLAIPGNAEDLDAGGGFRPDALEPVGTFLGST